jgi:hypothetical protein
MKGAPVKTHKEQGGAAFIDKFRLLAPEGRARVHDCVTRCRQSFVKNGTFPTKALDTIPAVC